MKPRMAFEDWMAQTEEYVEDDSPGALSQLRDTPWRDYWAKGMTPGQATRFALLDIGVDMGDEDGDLVPLDKI